MMIMDYVFTDNLPPQLDIPKNGILSHRIYEHEQFEAVIFGVDAGQTLFEHTAPVSSILYIIQGRSALTLGTETKHIKSGDWIEMPAQRPYTIHAQTPVVLVVLSAKHTSDTND
mgnify:CR=1 FL=1